MKHPTKNAVLDLANVIVWQNINPRTINATTPELLHKALFEPNILSSLQEKGQLVEIRVLAGNAKYEKIGAGDPTKFYVLQGNTRTYNMQYANDEAKKNDKKPVFSGVRAFVYENLDPEEITDIVHDHGARNLTRVQAYLAYEQEKMTGDSVLKIVTRIRPMLEQCGFKPIDKDRDVNPLTKDGQKEYAKVRKGTTDIWDKAYDGPKILRDAFVTRLEQNKVAPRDGEVRKLSDIFTTEKESDNPKGLYNKTNPGPKFLAAWAEYQKAQDEAAAVGVKPKSTAMANRDEVETAGKAAESRILKAVMKGFLNVQGFSKADFPRLDKIQIAFEAGNHVQANTLLDEFWSEKTAEQTTSSETAAK